MLNSLLARYRSAPCFYWHLKLAALNGGWDKLTDEERAFVGVEVSRRHDTSDGWVSPIESLIRQLGGGISPEDVYTLERLAGMDNPRRARLEFLGGDT